MCNALARHRRWQWSTFWTVYVSSHNTVRIKQLHQEPKFVKIKSNTTGFKTARMVFAGMKMCIFWSQYDLTIFFFCSLTFSELTMIILSCHLCKWPTRMVSLYWFIYVKLQICLVTQWQSTPLYMLAILHTWKNIKNHGTVVKAHPLLQVHVEYL